MSEKCGTSCQTNKQTNKVNRKESVVGAQRIFNAQHLLCVTQRNLPSAYMHACTLTHYLTSSSHKHALANTHSHQIHIQHVVYSTLTHRKGQVSVVSDAQQPTPDDTQFAKRTSKYRQVECQTQDENAAPQTSRVTGGRALTADEN